MKKHQEFILATKGDAHLSCLVESNTVPGFYMRQPGQSDTVGLVMMQDFILPHLSISQRAGLETNPEFRQFIPYVVAMTEGDDGKLMVLPYRRSKEIGEERLVGLTSIAFGGHVDSDTDVRYNSDKSVDLINTINATVRRELNEEIGIDIDPVKMPYYELGFIHDSTVEVNKYHLGVVIVVMLPKAFLEENELKAEEELEFLPWTSVDELAVSGTELESWSTMVIAHLSSVAKVIAE
jgi:predicted NUDIX family phosphoesterase